MEKKKKAVFKLKLHPQGYDRKEFNFNEIKNFIREKWGYENPEIEIVIDLSVKLGEGILEYHDPFLEGIKSYLKHKDKLKKF